MLNTQKINLSGIIYDSIVDGPGIRSVIFTQGCPHHCKGCHNSETWSYKENIVKTVDEIIEDVCEHNFTKKVTISGGEPLVQENVVELCKKFKELGFDIWVYTGYEFEQIKDLKTRNIVKYIDAIVCGKFEIDNKDLSQQFYGSTNQEIIHLSHGNMV